MRTAAISIALALCVSCSGDDKPVPDKGLDKGAEDAPGETVASGDPCSKVQQCAQDCEAATYAECVAACKATASQAALALLAAYETCAKEAKEGECKAQCASGPTDEACGACTVAACKAKWNDCYEDV